MQRDEYNTICAHCLCVSEKNGSLNECTCQLDSTSEHAILIFQAINVVTTYFFFK